MLNFNTADLFSAGLTILTFVCFVFWLRERKKKKMTVLAESNVSEAKPQKKKQTTSEFLASLFTVLFIVWFIRSFVFEPFQIPSGSMMPTLLPGDFILVQKFSYGIYDPVFHHKIISTGEPQRGDIAVFTDPSNPKINLIKRIIGLPGDTIVYKDHQLYIKKACHSADNTCNNKLEAVPKTFLKQSSYISEMTNDPMDEYKEQLGKVAHHILITPNLPPNIAEYLPPIYHQKNEPYDTWVVPKGHYFAMGDNRDNSLDSRYWGFLSEQDLIGKATFIWISFDFKKDSWIPSGVRFNRIGTIN